MADFVSAATVRYGCEAVAKGDHPDIIEMVERIVDGAHGGSYAGYTSADYCAVLRTRGGIVFRRITGELAAFFPLPAYRRDGIRLQFPIIEPQDENRGLQCFGQWLQLAVALISATPKQRPVNIYIPFPDDNLPSDKLVKMLGLCDVMPARTPLRDLPSGQRPAHRFDVQAEMLPRIIGAMLERHDPWAGSSTLTRMNTQGTAGRALVRLTQDCSPLDPIWLPTLISIAAGKLSVIGLEDLPRPPSRRFGA